MKAFNRLQSVKNLNLKFSINSNFNAYNKFKPKNNNVHNDNSHNNTVVATEKHCAKFYIGKSKRDSSGLLTSCAIYIPNTTCFRKNPSTTTSNDITSVLDIGSKTYVQLNGSSDLVVPKLQFDSSYSIFTFYEKPMLNFSPLNYKSSHKRNYNKNFISNQNDYYHQQSSIHSRSFKSSNSNSRIKRTLKQNVNSRSRIILKNQQLQGFSTCSNIYDNYYNNDNDDDEETEEIVAILDKPINSNSILNSNLNSIKQSQNLHNTNTNKLFIECYNKEKRKLIWSTKLSIPGIKFKYHCLCSMGDFIFVLITIKISSSSSSSSPYFYHLSVLLKSTGKEIGGVFNILDYNFNKVMDDQNQYTYTDNNLFGNNNSYNSNVSDSNQLDDNDKENLKFENFQKQKTYAIASSTTFLFIGINDELSSISLKSLFKALQTPSSLMMKLSNFGYHNNNNNNNLPLDISMHMCDYNDKSSFIKQLLDGDDDQFQSILKKPKFEEFNKYQLGFKINSIRMSPSERYLVCESNTTRYNEYENYELNNGNINHSNNTNNNNYNNYYNTINNINSNINKNQFQEIVTNYFICDIEKHENHILNVMCCYA